MARQKTNAEKRGPQVIPGFTGKLRVLPVTAPLINTRIAYFARNLKKVCRVTKIPATCWVDDSQTDVLPWKSTKSRGTDSDAKKQAACQSAGGHFTAGTHKEARDAKMELDFLSWAQGTRLGVRPGPVLRLCGEPLKPGKLMPLTRPEQAQAIQTAFAECARASGGRNAECAARIAGQLAPLGRADVSAAGAGMMRGILMGGYR